MEVMEHVAVQRVGVRMLFDAAFADRVYADPQGTLAGLGLSAEACGWLVAGDRRAYGTDPMRRHRGLQALLEEYPVSAAVLAAEGFAVRDHDVFFSGPRFHQAIQRRGSLAAAFGEHLAALATSPLAEGVVAIERAVAAARRGREPRWPEGAEVLLAPRVGVVRAPEGSLEAYGAFDAWLRADGGAPLARLLAEPGGGWPAVALPEAGEEAVLVEVGGDADDAPAALSFTSDELAILLEVARAGARREALVRVLGELGLEPVEAEELLVELTGDGLLVVRPD